MKGYNKKMTINGKFAESEAEQFDFPFVFHFVSLTGFKRISQCGIGHQFRL